jgi:hypothetical protein
MKRAGSRYISLSNRFADPDPYHSATDQKHCIKEKRICGNWLWQGNVEIYIFQERREKTDKSRVKAWMSEDEMPEVSPGDSY